MRPPTNNVLLALGSACRQSVFMPWASQQLQQLLVGSVTFSRCIWTADVKGSGTMYLNRLAAGRTAFGEEEFTARLKDIERLAGRSAQTVTIDIDLLLFNNRRHHLADWERDYVTRLIPDINETL